MTREEVADIVHGMPQGMDADDYLVELVSRAILREREACAKLLDDMAAKDKLSNYYGVAARAIRANRSQTATSAAISKWVGLEPQEIGQIWAKHKEVYGFGIELEQVLKERNT